MKIDNHLALPSGQSSLFLRSARGRRKHSILLLAGLAGALAAGSCGAETEPTGGKVASALPDKGDSVGQARALLASVNDAFARAIPPSTAESLMLDERAAAYSVVSQAAGQSLTVPLLADGSIQMGRAQGNVQVSVRLQDARPANGVLAGNRVVYPAAGPLTADGDRADVFIRVGTNVVEDFIYLPSAPVDAQIHYQVELTGVRKVVADTRGGLSLFDGAGRVAARMQAPWIMTHEGERLDVQTAVTGCEIAALADGSQCRITLSWDEQGVRYPALLDPGWVLVSPGMFVPRTRHTATLLDVTGDVLIAGGFNPLDGAPQAQAEVYHPNLGANGEFDIVGPGHVLNTARGSHTATYLPGPPAEVLIVGGSAVDGGPPLSTAELYDVGSATFAPVVDSMSRARRGHTATLLSDGRVLITGGSGVQPETAEIFDPSTEQFTDVPANMVQPRRHHTATLIDNSSVLIAGGFGPAFSTSTAELFDVTAGTFTAVPNTMTSPRAHATATRLVDGRIILGGGTNGVENYSTADVYVPSSGVFTQTTPMATARSHHSATRLPSGLVLLVGGQNNAGALAATELFDPNTTSFAADETMNVLRTDHAATSLLTGQVLLTGGSVGSPATSAELLLRANGEACTIDGECESGKCSPQMVCCDFECTDNCDACTEALTGVVDGDGECNPVPAGTPAAGNNSQQCSESISITLVCDGFGGVGIDNLVDCEPYGCDGAVCSTSCDVTGGCDDDAFCQVNSGVCVSQFPDGAECAAANQCDSGFCADGRCCEEVCSGSCESCAEPGDEGNCVLVTGAPREGKTCPAAEDEECAASCNGEQAACAFGAAPCGGSSCLDGLQTSGVCSAGACTEVEAPCEEYVCNEVGVACFRSCTSAEECADGFLCTSDGQCAVIEAVTCSDNFVVSPTGSKEDCAPYVCENAACRETCRSVNDCVSPRICDSSGKCIQAPAAAAVPSGCTMSAGRTSSKDDGSGAWLALGFLFAVTCRRSGRSANDR